MARPRCKLMPDCTVHPSIPHEHVMFSPRTGTPERAPENDGRRQFQLLDFGETAEEAAKNAKLLMDSGFLEPYLKRSYRLTPKGESSEDEIKKMLRDAYDSTRKDSWARERAEEERKDREWSARENAKVEARAAARAAGTEPATQPDETPEQ